MLGNSEARSLPISVDDDKLRAFCARWGVTELDLFGSVLREDFHVGSDVDVLVTLAEDRKPTLFTLIQMEDDLRDIFGRTVDLVLRQSVEQSDNYVRRDHILTHRLPLYVAR